MSPSGLLWFVALVYGVCAVICFADAIAADAKDAKRRGRNE